MFDVSSPSDSPSPDGQFQRHAGELLRFLTRQLNCSELAADLRQETWLRFRRAQPGEIGNLRAFLYRIARNLVIDHRRQLDARAPQEPMDEQLESPIPGPERYASGSQQLAQLHALLQELPPHVRKALLWNRLDGLTQREIGERLGVSESMAGRYILRALEYCQSRMDDPS